MRLPKASQLNFLWRSIRLKPPVLLAKRFRSRTPSFVWPPCQTRTLCSTIVLRKEIPQPSEQTEEKIDLDIWKSVMMSPAPQEEREDKQEVTLGGSEEGAVCSSLETAREQVQMWREAGKLVPEEISEEQLLTLQELSTKSSKKKFLKYLAIKENHKKSRKKKQEKKRSEKVMEMEEKKNKEGDVGQGENAVADIQNTFLVHIWSRSMDIAYGWRAAQSMVFGQPLVFDMSYEQVMSRRELDNTVSQLLESEGWNRRSPDPFHLHFCNLQPDSAYQRELMKRYGDAWDRLLITASSEGCVDIFPRDQLVYLTADSPNVLKTFDHNKVYIVGALVDKSIQSGVSLANAKRLNLATARFPLDQFLHWDIGAKNLTLDQVIRILLTLKETGKWEAALEFVPKRKHSGFHQPAHAASARSFRTDKVQTFVKKEKGALKSFKNGTLVSSEADPIRDTGRKPRVQSGLRDLLKSKISVGQDIKPKSRKNWWEEE
ncbi:hypothetical protein GJAV_G00210380 [Gymnothorax javanicus]|nr:hypothetical protein GJAV_G00210380 [Gymnothorax javanicus]